MSGARTAPPPANPHRPPPGRGPGAWAMSAGMPAEKSMDFWPSARRVLGRLDPERVQVFLVLLLAVAGVAFAVVGPKILGNATTIIFEGVIGKQLPAGITQQQAIDAARARGDDGFANLLSGMTVVPGQGVDFTQLAHVLLVVLVLYVVSAVCTFGQARLLAGVVARTVLRLRADVEDKLHRLPLSYFDTRPRGELLSRVTNDIDNVQQTMQQTLSQLLNSLLTLVGVLTMMVLISPLLSVVALVSVPLSVLVTRMIAKRSQPMFVQQWGQTGRLNAHIEETYTGHSLVKVFGHQHEAEEVFAERNEALFRASYMAQFLSGIIMPAIMFIGNLNYVVRRGDRRPAGRVRIAVAGRRAGVHPVLAAVQPAAHPGGVDGQPAPVRRGVGRAGVRPPRRAGAGPGPGRARAAAGHPRSGRVRARVVPLRARRPADRGPVAGRGTRPVGRDRRPTGAGKTTLVNLVMRFYELDGGRITLDGVDIASVRRDDLRGQIGMVLQDAWLFNGTIRDNIAYGRPDATEDEILEAATAPRTWTGSCTRCPMATTP